MPRLIQLQSAWLPGLEVADVRVHGTTGMTPRARFEREALRALPAKGPFLQCAGCAS